jgi:hypothetical protein
LVLFFVFELLLSAAYKMPYPPNALGWEITFVCIWVLIELARTRIGRGVGAWGPPCT